MIISNLKSWILTIIITLWLCIAMVSAYLRMPCDSVTLQVRDPILGAGKSYFGHAHIVGGAPYFDATVTYDALRSTSCSSCAFQDDKSLYWAPYLYFYNNVTKEFIGAPPANTNFDVYYHWLGADIEDIQPIPADLRMIAGNSSATSPPKANQIFYQCPSDPDSPKYNQFPIDYCEYGSIKATVIFPSCWDGVNEPTTPSATHVAYPDIGDDESYESNDASCPSGFTTHLPTLFLEIWYSIADFKDMWTGGKGYPVLAQGDPNGYGLHADFIMGWEESVFEEVVSQCSGEVAPQYTGNGNVEDCSPLRSSMYPSSDASVAAPDASCTATLDDSSYYGTLSGLPNSATNTLKARTIDYEGLTTSVFDGSGAASTTGATTGVTTGATTGVTTGASTGATTGVTTGASTGVTTGATTGVTTGASTDATTGASTDATTGVTTGATTGVTTDATTGANTDATTGVTTGASTGASTGVTTGATTGVTTGVTTGATTGVTTGASTDATTGASTDATTGVTTGASTGASTDATLDANNTTGGYNGDNVYFADTGTTAGGNADSTGNYDDGNTGVDATTNDVVTSVDTVALYADTSPVDATGSSTAVDTNSDTTTGDTGNSSESSENPGTTVTASSGSTCTCYKKRNVKELIKRRAKKKKNTDTAHKDKFFRRAEL